MGSIWSPGISHLGVGIGSIQYSLVGREVNSFPSVQLLLTCKQSAYRLYTKRTWNKTHILGFTNKLLLKKTKRSEFAQADPPRSKLLGMLPYFNIKSKGYFCPKSGHFLPFWIFAINIVLRVAMIMLFL